VNPALFRELLSPGGQEVLSAASRLASNEEAYLSELGALRRACPEASRALAGAALDTALLRSRAQHKFSRASTMYFTREALEQATTEAVGHYHAQRFAGQPRVADLGCGIGGDTLHLAAVSEVAAVDRDELRVLMARENLAAYGAKARLLLADLVSPHALKALGIERHAIFCDPARREAGRRLFHTQAYSPPLSSVLDWQHAWPGRPTGVKLSPGVDLCELPPAECEVEFVSHGGELKEAMLWMGPLCTAPRRATLLPQGESLVGSSSEVAAVSEPMAFLYEPDPAILRAGLVAELARRLDAAQVDADIAYLTSNQLVPTPFARAFALEAAMPFGLKRLREWLRARGVGQVVIKKRGSPLEPSELEHALRLRGDARRTIFLTHVRGEPFVLVGEPIVSGE
jgi:SAM-dependent methyltransferase